MSAHPYVSEWRESRLQGMTTTLRKIRAADPCGMRLKNGQRGYLKLRHHLGRGYGDDTPIDITTIIDNNGLDYALWCLSTVDGHAREMLLYAYWCARQVPSLMEVPRSVAAPDVAASDDELAAARAAGTEAAWAALAARAALAATDASWAALPAKEGARAALAAARDARDAASAAQADELRRICAEIAAGRDPYPAAGVIA